MSALATIASGPSDQSNLCTNLTATRSRLRYEFALGRTFLPPSPAHNGTYGRQGSRSEIARIAGYGRSERVWCATVSWLSVCSYGSMWMIATMGDENR
jgi:hypothetical protein